MDNKLAASLTKLLDNKNRHDEFVSLYYDFFPNTTFDPYEFIRIVNELQENGLEISISQIIKEDK